ncbi:MAG: tail fiber protein [Verrucomicrobiota bacterium]
MEPYIGQIQPFGFNFAPRGWQLTNGQTLPIASNTALFSLLGCTFGGDCRSTFNLPDLRGRSAVGVGNGAGLSNIAWGQRGGAEYVTLTTAELPSHSMPVSIPAHNAGGTQQTPGGHYLAGLATGQIYSTTQDATLASFNTGNVGGGQSVYIRNPFLGIYYAIATTGIFPSRS